MKKSQSIFLLSGLVPLVAAPIAIVASCSNDTTTSTTQTEAGKEVARLNEVIKSNKLKIKEGTTFNETMLDELNKTPDKLFDYLDEKELALDKTKFDYKIDGLTGIDVKPKQDAPAPETKTMNFKFKVINKQTTSESALTEPATVSYQYQATAQPPTEPTPLEKFVAKIEAAYDSKAFKLKPAKATIPQAEIEALKTNPAKFLSDYTDGLPTENGYSTKVVAANFAVSDKQLKADRPQVIKFKVTVTEDATKTDKLTKEFSFDFTLQETQAPIQTKTKTTAKTGVTATQLNLQTNKVTEAQPKITKDWIVQNITKLVNGDHEVTKAADVTSFTVTPDTRDSKKLTLVFKLAAGTYYSADNTLATAQSGDFRFEITGFTKAETARVKKAEFNASELGAGLQNQNFQQLNQTLNTRNWLFPNRDKYLQGDLVPGTDVNNFINQTPITGTSTLISFTQNASDQTRATMRFPIRVGRTYDSNGIVTTNLTEITFVVVIGK